MVGEEVSVPVGSTVGEAEADKVSVGGWDVAIRVFGLLELHAAKISASTMLSPHKAAENLRDISTPTL